VEISSDEIGGSLRLEFRLLEGFAIGDMDATSQKRVLIGIAVTVSAGWILAGVPWAASTFAEQAAEQITKEQIYVHERSTEHADTRQLEIEHARTNAEIGAMKEQLTRVEGSVEQLIQLQLDR
tara:strand:+ start:299 stop:667 length:369 start_codon:yes stop_codon:yes gene_type:complete